MKALKMFGRILITIFFIVLIAAIILVLSYTLSSPDKTIGSESRGLITGPWEQLQDTNDDDQALWKFSFTQNGDFQIVEGDELIAEGYCKIDDDSGKIKLFILPWKVTDEFSKYVKYFMFAEVSYSNLEVSLDDDDEIVEGEEPTVQFLIRTNDGSDESEVFTCKMYEVTIDLYESEYDLTKDA